MPNKVDGGITYLTVAGSAGSETYQAPVTADYINADRDFIWFDGVGDQRTVTTAELVGYDLQRTPIKYDDTSPNAIVAIMILSTAVTGAKRDNLFRDFWLSPWWDDSFNVYGHIKSNRSGEQSVWGVTNMKLALSCVRSDITKRTGTEYVSAISDLGDYDNNAEQSTEDYQPLLESVGLKFDGTNDFLDVGNDASLHFTTAFTFVGWVKTLDHTLANQAIACHGITDGQRSWQVSFALHNVSPVEMSVMFYLTPDGTQANRIYIIADNVANANLVADDTWCFIVCIYDNSATPKMKLYINNIAITVATTGTPPTTINPSSTENLTIGKGLNSPLKGSVDFAKLFNVALTEAQMTTIYDNTKSRYGY